MMLCKKGKPITEIAVKIYDFDTLESLNQVSEELEKTWDEVINYALEKFLKEIYSMREIKRADRIYGKEDEE
jgi:hypothetical protein